MTFSHAEGTESVKRYVIVSGATHGVVIASELSPEYSAGIDHNAALRGRWEAGVIALAAEKLSAAHLDARDLRVVGTWNGEDDLDAYSDLGISDQMVIAAAQSLYDGEDLTVDGNAELSGLNIQLWQWMEPSEVMDRLTTLGPVQNERLTRPMVEEAIDHALVEHRRAFASDELQDFHTHRASWRQALTSCRDLAANDEDRSYWDHELRSYDRAQDAFAALVPHGNASTAVQANDQEGPRP